MTCSAAKDEKERRHTADLLFIKSDFCLFLLTGGKKILYTSTAAQSVGFYTCLTAATGSTKSTNVTLHVVETATRMKHALQQTEIKVQLQSEPCTDLRSVSSFPSDVTGLKTQNSALISAVTSG